MGDPSFKGEEMGEALKMIELAMWCIHIDYRERPAISIVFKSLKGIIQNFSTSLSPLADDPKVVVHLE